MVRIKRTMFLFAVRYVVYVGDVRVGKHRTYDGACAQTFMIGCVG